MPGTFYKVQRLPRSTRWDDPPARPYEHLPGEWPPSDRTHRILTYNSSDRVVVCLPPMLIPSTGDGNPRFGHYGLISRDATVNEVEAMLEAVATHLTPARGPEDCWYGVKVGSFQIYGSTPDRFCTDLRTITDLIVDDGSPQPTMDTREVVGAALWPMKTGWVFLTYCRFRRPDAELIRFGLLTRRLDADSDPIATVFESIGHPDTAVEDIWPWRRHDIDGWRHELTRTELVTGLMELPLFHGTNPIYPPRPRSCSPNESPDRSSSR